MAKFLPPERGVWPVSDGCLVRSVCATEQKPTASFTLTTECWIPGSSQSPAEVGGSLGIARSYLASPLSQGRLWHYLIISGGKMRGVSGPHVPLPFEQEAGDPPADLGATSFLSTLLLASLEDFLSGWPSMSPAGILTSLPSLPLCMCPEISKAQLGELLASRV